MIKINTQGSLLILWILLAIWTTIGCKSKNISRTPTLTPSQQVQPTKADQPTKHVTFQPPDSEKDSHSRIRAGMDFFDKYSDPLVRDDFLNRVTLPLPGLKLLLTRSDLTDNLHTKITRKIRERTTKKQQDGSI
jgi:hypothetical protein